MACVWNILVTPFVLDIPSPPVLKRQLKKVLLPFLLNHCILKLSRAKDKFHKILKMGALFWFLSCIGNSEQEPIMFSFYYLDNCLRKEFVFSEGVAFFQGTFPWIILFVPHGKTWRTEQLSVLFYKFENIIELKKHLPEFEPALSLFSYNIYPQIIIIV